MNSTLTRSSYFRDLRGYFAVLLLFWIVSAWLFIQYGYHGTFAALNPYRIPAAGYASFYFFTHLGDGLILPVMLLLFLWWKDPGLAITGIIAMLVTGLVTHALKIGLFSDFDRPTLVFGNTPGFSFFQPDPPVHHSFPSGHATSFATGGLFFAWYWVRRFRWMPILVGLFTVAGCFTRVLIGVHFPGDIFVGSIIGSIVGLAVLVMVHPKLQRWADGWPKSSRRTADLVVGLLIPLVFTVQYLNVIGVY